MAVQCPRCLEIAQDHDVRCPCCNEDLVSALVLFVDESEIDLDGQLGVGSARSPSRKERFRELYESARPLPAIDEAAAGGSFLCRSSWPGGPRRVSMSMVVSRIIDQTAPATAAAVDAWWFNRRPRGVVADGPERLTVNRPVCVAPAAYVRRMPARLYRRPRWVGDDVELDLLPWSKDASELTLRPLRYRANRSERYFRAAAALLDLFASELVAEADAATKVATIQS